MTLPHLALEGDPARPLRAAGELGEEDRLAGATQAGQRPVRMERLLGDEGIELGQQPVAPGQVWRPDAVPGSERIGQLFGSMYRLGLGHGIYPLSCVVRPRDASGRRLGRVVHLKSTLPYCAPAGTRNQERLRAAFWIASR